MARIKHPNPPSEGTFTDRVGGIVFYDGFADVDLTDAPILRSYYVQHQYDIDETSELDDLTVKQLKAMADEHDIEYKAGVKKVELIDAIATKIEEDAATTDPATGQPAYAIVETADGSVVGDGTNLVTLHDDGTASVDEEYGPDSVSLPSTPSVDDDAPQVGRIDGAQPLNATIPRV